VSGDVIVISQVPPPFHGSTVMTVVFLETLDALRRPYRLVDRRFSKSLGDVGRFQLSKLFASAGLILRLLVALVRKRPEQVVFFMTNRTASFLVDWVLSEILRLFGTRTVGYLHTQGYTDLAKRGFVWRVLVRRLLTSAQTLVCLSSALESDVRTLAPKARIVSIANTPHRVPDDLGAIDAGTDLTVLFLSNLIPEKGIGEFIELGNHFASQGSSIRFVAAGAPISEPQLAELRASAAPNTDLLGAVGPERKWELLQEASVLVFPSRYPFEAQPLVIVESMAAGLPVVAFDIGGIGDLVDDGQTGRLLTVGDAVGMREAVDELIRSPQTRTDMTTAARDSFESKYSRTAYEEAWHDVLTR